MSSHPLTQTVRLVIEKYRRDNIGDMAAALAYFTIFSIFPLLLIVISLVGFFLDPQQFDVQEQLFGAISSSEIRDLITQTLTYFAQTRVGAGLLGAFTLLLAATGLFGALTRALRSIWSVRADSNGSGVRTAVTMMVAERLISFVLLLGIAGLILAAILGNMILSLLSAYADWLPLSGFLVQLARRILTIALITVAFATIYKVLPRPLPCWRDVWPAALAAAIAFTALQSLAELIFSRVDFSSFGVLGGAMTLLLWIYISGQILLVGAELSYAWSHVLGSRKDLGET